MDNKGSFWRTQPVIKSEEELDKFEVKIPENIPNTPYELPNNLCWENIDIEDSVELDLIHSFLSENYLEDSNSKFRFSYSKEFLFWALKTPSYNKDYFVCIKNNEKKIIGFISAVPSLLAIKTKKNSDKKVIKVVDINFMCVSKKERNKRLAPLLIKEITRRVNLNGIYQAVYTSGKSISFPLVKGGFYHRLLNIEKLIQLGFIDVFYGYGNDSIKDNNEDNSKSNEIKKNIEIGKVTKEMYAKTVERYKEMYELPSSVENSKLQRAEEKHLKEIKELLQKEHENLSYYREYFDEEDFRHRFLGDQKSVKSFVVLENGKVKGFVSYYEIDTIVLTETNKGETIKGGFLLHLLKGDILAEEILLEVLIKGKKDGIDTFNVLDLGLESDFLKSLKFLEGDGVLNYYIYNWKYERIKKSEICYKMF